MSRWIIRNLRIEPTTSLLTTIMEYEDHHNGNLTNVTGLFDDMHRIAWFQPSTDVPMLIVGGLAVVFNAFIIYIVQSRRTLQTSSNTILVSLCASDLLYGLVTVPMQVACAVFMVNDLCIVTDTLVKFISVSTIIHILLITVDRYIFIVYALRYYAIVRKRRVVGTLLGVWSVNAVITLVRLHWALRVDVSDDEGDDVHRQEFIYIVFRLATFFCLLLTVVLVLDIHMLIVLGRQVRKIVRQNLPRECLLQEKRLKYQQRRAILMCIFMFLINFAFWLPYFTYDLWQTHDGFGIIGEYAILIARILTSVLNPIINTIGRQSLRDEVLKKLPCRCRTTPDLRTEDTPLNEF
ncbi:melanocyte-stimulating hormone receptor [Nematostella vectensis]|uniref:melanocyte-stimulating hormone receptor n=1 Tax=Nematostella vectensis TaxID=45351 RepID=UPI00138FCDE3|nr:melanocyte-stimulating hormone receptor [Nematostella vectensis]